MAYEKKQIFPAGTDVCWISLRFAFDSHLHRTTHSPKPDKPDLAVSGTSEWIYFWSIVVLVAWVFMA